MTVREAVLATIQLAAVRDVEAQAIDIEIGAELGDELHSERLTRLMSAPRPAEAALISHLETLPDDTLFPAKRIVRQIGVQAKDVTGVPSPHVHQGANPEERRRIRRRALREPRPASDGHPDGSQ